MDVRHNLKKNNIKFHYLILQLLDLSSVLKSMNHTHNQASHCLCYLQYKTNLGGNNSQCLVTCLCLQPVSQRKEVMSYIKCSQCAQLQRMTVCHDTHLLSPQELPSRWLLLQYYVFYVCQEVKQVEKPCPTLLLSLCLTQKVTGRKHTFAKATNKWIPSSNF